MSLHRDVDIDLTDDHAATEEWAWVEAFRVACGVPATVEDPVLIANLAQALVTHADTSRDGPG